MGAGQILQNKINSATSALWDRLPSISSLKIFDIETNTQNKHFVNFFVAVGVISLTKLTLNFASTLSKSLKFSKLPTSKQLLQKYGFHTWILIADCRQNEEYSNFFAKNGFSLILMGSQQDVRIAKDQAQLINPSINTQVIVVNWKKEESNVAFYEQLVKNLQKYDISFLVLPKILQPHQIIPTHLQHVQPFSHIYLLVRFFGQKLKWRSYKSAIILPSHSPHQQITSSNGISKSLIAGSDAFGRIISYQFRDSIEVVVAREGVENAIKSLNLQRISN